MKCCPTCGRAFPPKIDVGGKKRQLIFDYVARHPEGVTVGQIMEYVYAEDPNGGPESSNVVAVQAWHINRYLETRGAPYRIRGRGGPGSIYRLYTVYRGKEIPAGVKL